MDDRPEPKSREDAPTTAMGAGPAEDRFPVRDWDGYELLEYLGSGAMGSVYKAFDRRLQRPVALKFLLGDNPTLIERFQAEARAQARVEHDNLCKIYEVGEAEGRHYIAMQFIDGERLSAAARKMTLAEKVLAVRDIARALHEAHRAGLIHRDVKPANVMVTHSKDGSWKPYVLDFGLAREAHAAGRTMTGVVLGTPSYMPPEQARGEIHKLDRRSDVYGLGATLYDMLTDRPPFEGDTIHQVIPQVLDDVPRSPRDTHTEVPADIESIVLKCLRKDPAERYDSARAFADDLQRWLDGEPVQARPTNRWYRLRMKARKNRVAVAVAAAAIPLVLAGIGWGVWNQWTSARQQQLAQDFGQRVQKIESMARLSAMAPLHDVRPERDAVRAQMAAIEDAMQRVGKIARGPGQYALGRGHLALGEVDDAREHLEAAWAAGYRPPEVSYALGLVLGRQYQERLQDIATISGADEREEKRAAAQKELRDPALEQFRLAASVETESPQYLEALMALYEDRDEEALAEAREAFAGHMWLYEAKRLEGEVLQLMGDDARDRGEYDAAADRYGESVTALEKAAEVAPSDPVTHVQLARVALSRIGLEVNHRGLDVQPYFGEGIRATDLAVATNPDDSDAFLVRAQIQKRMAEYLISQGKDAGGHLDDAIAAGERAVALDPKSAGAHQILGSTYRQIGKDVRRRGEDPRPAFRKAIAAYEAAGSIEPDWSFHASLGLLYKDIAVYQSGVGEDPRANLESAISNYERSIELRPREFSTFYNLGVARSEFANYDALRGVDPSEPLKASITAFQGALELNPGHPLVLQRLATSYDNLAVYELEHGRDPTANLDLALGALTTAIETNPESAYLSNLHDERGISYTTRARHAVARGMDPTEDIDRARQEFASAIAANGSYPYAHANLAYLLSIAAEHEGRLGKDPRTFEELALQSGRTALSMDPTSRFARLAMIRALQAVAFHDLESGRDPSAFLSQVFDIVEELRAANSDDPDACYWLGVAITNDASWCAVKRDATPRFVEALDVLERAARMAPDLAACQLALADAHARLARCRVLHGAPPDSDIARGLEAADAALELDPALFEALAVRGALLLARAEHAAGSAPRESTVDEAEDALNRALSGNRHLTHRYGPVLARVEEMRTAADRT